MKLFVGFLICIIIGAGFFLLIPGRTIVVQAPVTAAAEALEDGKVQEVEPVAAIPTPVASSATAVATAGNVVGKNYGDIVNQPQLPNPPPIAKGIYLTGWSAGSNSRLTSLISFVKRTEINSVVIDIKDYSGYMSYAFDFPLAKEAGAFGDLRILRPNTVIKRLHDESIYVIARLTVFQDPILAKAHPEWALKNKATGEVWKDRSGLAWIDPAAKPAWDYVAAIAKDAIARGFDEINFDYIRFASDGNLSNIEFPYWDMKTPRHKVINDFFEFLRAELGTAKISAGLFGLTTVNPDDLGIGQVIEDAYANFDYVSPMIYPSHFAEGFLGYKNPAKNPYEIIKYSMDRASDRLLMITVTEMETVGTSTVKKTITRARTPEEAFRAQLRPWLQDFDLGATYDASMVKTQIQATYDT